MAKQFFRFYMLFEPYSRSDLAHGYDVLADRLRSPDLDVHHVRHPEGHENVLASDNIFLLKQIQTRGEERFVFGTLVDQELWPEYMRDTFDIIS